MGSYTLRKLPFHDRLRNTPVEPMHTLKNISECIVKFISGFKDTVQVRNEEKNLKRFKTSWVKTVDQGGKRIQCIPDAPFSLKKDELNIANRRLMNITTPSGMDWKAQKLFGKGAHRMKSVEWRHVLSSGILKYCIRGLLGKDQKTTLIELCNVVQLLCAEEVIFPHILMHWSTGCTVYFHVLRGTFLSRFTLSHSTFYITCRCTSDDLDHCTALDVSNGTVQFVDRT